MPTFKPVDIKKKADTKEKKQSEKSYILKLNFKGREELLNNLKKSAKLNFRTVEQQAIYYIWKELDSN